MAHYTRVAVPMFWSFYPTLGRLASISDGGRMSLAKKDHNIASG